MFSLFFLCPLVVESSFGFQGNAKRQASGAHGILEEFTNSLMACGILKADNTISQVLAQKNKAFICSDIHDSTLHTNTFYSLLPVSWSADHPNNLHPIISSKSTIQRINLQEEHMPPF